LEYLEEYSEILELFATPKAILKANISFSINPFPNRPFQENYINKFIEKRQKKAKDNERTGKYFSDQMRRNKW
jgi:hypothetical protein